MNWFNEYPIKSHQSACFGNFGAGDPQRENVKSMVNGNMHLGPMLDHICYYYKPNGTHFSLIPQYVSLFFCPSLSSVSPWKKKFEIDWTEIMEET